MSHHRHHGGNELFAFLAGRAIGAARAEEQAEITIRAARAAERRAQISSPSPYVGHSQTNAYKEEKRDTPLPASRADHAEAVLCYLHKFEAELLKRRQDINEKNEDRFPRLSQIPMWPQIVLPTMEEVVSLLNRDSVWTVEGLNKFSVRLATELFLSAENYFELFAPDSSLYLAKRIEELFLGWAQEWMLAIRMLNRSAGHRNSSLSIMKKFNKANFERIIPDLVIRVPSLDRIEKMIKNAGVDRWQKFFDFQNNLEKEVFSDVLSDVDFSKIKSQFEKVGRFGSVVGLEIYKEYRVRPPEWMLKEKKSRWKFW
jgi:hypothetical protein